MDVVLDTNCLVMSLSRHGAYYPVWRDFVAGRYTLCYTNEILTEYEEVLTAKVGKEIAANIISAILNLPNTKAVQTYFRLQIISADPDDNKFVDCAFKSNAHFIVTQDHHYDVLRQIDFPQIDVIDIDTFLTLLETRNTNSQPS